MNTTNHPDKKKTRALIITVLALAGIMVLSGCTTPLEETEEYLAGYEAGSEEGHQVGRDIGYDEGYQDGEDNGYGEGLIDGSEEGYEAGLDHEPPEAIANITCDQFDCTFESESEAGSSPIAETHWLFEDTTNGISHNEAYGVSADRSYNETGEYWVLLTVTDEHGVAGQVNQTFTVPGLEPPTTSFDVSCAGLNCTFTGESDHGDYNITSSSWLITDEDGNTTTHTDDPLEHTFSETGNFTVLRELEDSEGDLWTHEETIFVSD